MREMASHENSHRQRKPGRPLNEIYDAGNDASI